MKWKITGRFLLAIMITIMVSVIVFTGVSLFPAINWDRGPDPYNLWDLPGNYTLDFAKYISLEEGKVVIDKKGVDELKKHFLWIQVLDETGKEIYSRFKPEEIPTHYSPGRLVYYHEKSGRLGNSTILAGLVELNQQEICYIIGFPADKMRINSYVYNPRTVISDIFKIIMKAAVVSLIIGTLIAYIFSTNLINTIVRIIAAIKELARGDYSDKGSNVKLFQKVFSNLNELATTLKLNKVERKKTEQIREEWIANITHDVRTPLSSIKGYSEVLLDPEYNLSEEEQAKYAEIIMEKSNYISELISDLKLTYQLQHDLVPLEKKEENLVEIVRESVISIINNREAQEVNINFETKAEVIPLMCNARLLQRSIINIIHNAIIHNPSGTRIDVRIFKLENQHNRIKIEIEDQGKGIKDENLNRLFNRYYRGTNTDQKDQSTGLGLAIAKQIIEFHNGKIEVESEVGVGSRVIIFLKGYCGTSQ